MTERPAHEVAPWIRMVRAKTTIWVDIADEPIVLREDGSIHIEIPADQHAFDIIIDPSLFPELRRVLGEGEESDGVPR